MLVQDILKSDTVESFDAAEATAPDTFPGSPPEPLVQTRQAPAPAPKPAEPAKAAPARPAVGNTGSLFFTADADTPSSVTRHLFEPMPAPAVVQAPPMPEGETQGEGPDAALLAGNDEAGRPT